MTRHIVYLGSAERPTDFASCGDHGIGKCFDARLELPKAIAKGEDVCALRYIKSSDGQGGEMRKVDNSLIVAFCFAFFPKMRREGEHFTF